MLSKLIKKTNVNFLILNIVSLIIWLVLSYLIYPFAYNVICGPFEITDEEILAFAETVETTKTDFPKWGHRKWTFNDVNYTWEFDTIIVPSNILNIPYFSMPYYKRGNQFYFKFNFDSPKDYLYLNLIMENPSTSFRSKPVSLRFGDVSGKWMYMLPYGSYKDVQNGAILTSANPEFLKELCEKTRTVAFPYPDPDESMFTYNEFNEFSDVKLDYDRVLSGKLDYNSVLNIMIHAGGKFVLYTWTGIIILGIYLILLLISTYKCIARFIDEKKHPIFKRNIDLDSLQKELDKECKRKGRIFTTEHWIIKKKLFTLRVCRNTSLDED